MPASFEPFGVLHAVVLLVSAAAWWGTIRWARAVKGTPREEPWRRSFAVFVWATNLAWSVRQALPAHFGLGHSLPLHFCDLAWMAAGWSLWCAGDPGLARHQIPVLWGFALSLLGYATPAVTAGPGSVHFWSFWVTHWQILAVALVNVLVRGTRGDARGLRRALGVALGAFVAVTALNLAIGTSYFFTGRAKPDNVSPIDLLGPWPLRIAWIGLLGAAALVVVWLPLRRRRA
jgi:hypothetical integral membrane protein (TIGR02206 family)